MKVTLKANTIPATITREDAAAKANRSISSIDKAIAANQLDYGKLSRLVLIVDNKKLQDYIVECKARDWCNKNNFHHAKYGTLQEVYKAFVATRHYTEKQLSQLTALCKF